MNLIRGSGKYRNWRESIFDRDNYTCQICHREGGQLNAHHIKSFKDLTEKYNITDLDDAIKCRELWNMNNGITLCNHCHKWIHSINPVNQQ